MTQSRLLRPLLGIIVTLSAAAHLSSAPAGIESATCEMVQPGLYRIAFSTPAAAGSVTVYASSRPDSIDAIIPPTRALQSPIDIAVPDDGRRVYFHLKTNGGASRVVALRRLPLEGAGNFRDLGGYPTADGRHVKWGLVYRSGQLADLTVRDHAYLNRAGVKVVCDLRTPGERERQPTRWTGPEIVSTPILTDADIQAATASASPDEFARQLATAAEGQLAQTGAGLYDRFVLQYVDSYRQVFRRLVDSDSPTVTHCTAGRDRTGVFGAILLHALGVPREIAIEDYLLTDRFRLTDAFIAQTQRELQARYLLAELPDANAVRTMQALHRETLESTFDTLERTYGSFDAFLHKGLGLTDRDLERLRSRLLEN